MEKKEHQQEAGEDDQEEEREEVEGKTGGVGCKRFVRGKKAMKIQQ